MRSVFSVDVEDWFHILDLKSAPAVAEWAALPSRVEKNFMKLLDLFSEAGSTVTCFFLGWVGERFPHLVREAHRRGHEIASHGYAHRLVFELKREEFFEDALVSRKILEDLTGEPVIGYRAAGFSITEDTGWFAEKLIEAGYLYDSSVFPAARQHGGMKGGCHAPCFIGEPSKDLLEFPMTVGSLLGLRFCFCGGGYLRLFPLAFIRRMANRVLAEGRPVIFYVHPREIDPVHPRLSMPFVRRFKSYVNLRSTETKIRKLLAEFEVTSFRELIASDLESLLPPGSEADILRFNGRLTRASEVNRI
ncbi:MAG TPA: XrtA system polysaccharide deacetylase [Terriglobia bacterium]|nr:XrtA system polysaccharide deacetylase [Terriglobia bacterium]